MTITFLFLTSAPNKIISFVTINALRLLQILEIRKMSFASLSHYSAVCKKFSITRRLRVISTTTLPSSDGIEN